MKFRKRLFPSCDRSTHHCNQGRTRNYFAHLTDLTPQGKVRANRHKEATSKMKVLNIGLMAIASLSIHWPLTTMALPPPAETPEEVLRTEIILEARSPLTGEPLTAAEYAQLQETLAENPTPLVASEIRELILLLQLRRVFRPILPFLP
jgi:hypothetical protein